MKNQNSKDYTSTDSHYDYKPWNPALFVDRSETSSEIHLKRQKVYQYTLGAIRHHQYIYKDENGVEQVRRLYLNEVQSQTVFFDREHQPREDTFGVQYADMKVEVWNSDTIDAARRIQKEEGVRPIVLNMASYVTAGGGVRRGSGAQEENLFRRTDYCRSLYQYMYFADHYHDVGVVSNPHYSYPLDKLDGAVYSPDITVFRGNEAEGYPFLKDPFILDFVAIAAMCFRKEYRPHVYTPDEEQIIRHKISLLLRICKSTGHSHLVLSALGCGAYHNPPQSVSRFFREALESEEFKNSFCHVVFAIMDDGNKDGNYCQFLHQ